MKVQIPFRELLSVIKTLTPLQKKRLTQELAEEKTDVGGDKAAFIEMLINGPVFTEKEIRVIEENRKSIAKWRTKN